MNPMVFTIVAWENELEIQRQVQRKQRYGVGVILAKDPRPRRKTLKSIFAWISRRRGSSTQRSCECPQEGCY